MVNDHFAEAFIHRAGGHRVLGVRLEGFTYWNAACLDFIKSPLAGYEGPVADLNTLLWAIACCRARYPHRPRLTPRLRKWVPFRFACSHRSPVARGLQLWREVAAFYEYLRDYNSRPIYGQNEESRPVETPWYLFSVVALMRDRATVYNRPRMTLADAWNSEAGPTAWYGAANAELHGARLELLTPELEEAFKKAGAL